MANKRKTDPEHIKILKIEYVKRNYQKLKEKRHDKYIRNREKIILERREYRAKNREKCLLSLKKCYRKNKDKRLERDRQYRMKNKEKIKDRLTRYRRSHPIETKTRNRNRERLLSCSIQDFTTSDWNFCLEYWNHQCAICGKKAQPGIVICEDHWIPLSKGGKTSRTNIVPLCHGIGGCNNKKHCFYPEQWLVKTLGKEKAQEKIKEINFYFEEVKAKPICARVS